MLGITDTTTDAEMKNLEDVATVRSAKELKMSARQKHIMSEIRKMNETVGDLEDGTGRLKRTGDVKTFVDEKGKYPEWMSRRAIKKLKDNLRRDRKHDKKKRKKAEQFQTKNRKVLKAKNKKNKAKGKKERKVAEILSASLSTSVST